MKKDKDKKRGSVGLNHAIAYMHTLNNKLVSLQLTSGNIIGIGISAIQITLGALIVSHPIWYLDFILAPLCSALAIAIERLSLGGLSSVRRSVGKLVLLADAYFEMQQLEQRAPTPLEEHNYKRQKSMQIWTLVGALIVVALGVGISGFVGDQFWQWVWSPAGEPLATILGLACAAVISLGFVYSELFKRPGDEEVEDRVNDDRIQVAVLRKAESDLQINLSLEAFGNVRSDADKKQKAVTRIEEVAQQRLEAYADRIGELALNGGQVPLLNGPKEETTVNALPAPVVPVEGQMEQAQVPVEDHVEQEEVLVESHMAREEVPAEDHVEQDEEEIFHTEQAEGFHMEQGEASAEDQVEQEEEVEGFHMAQEKSVEAFYSELDEQAEMDHMVQEEEPAEGHVAQSEEGHAAPSRPTVVRSYYAQYRDVLLAALTENPNMSLNALMELTNDCPKTTVRRWKRKAAAEVARMAQEQASAEGHVAPAVGTDVEQGEGHMEQEEQAEVVQVASEEEVEVDHMAPMEQSHVELEEVPVVVVEADVEQSEEADEEEALQVAQEQQPEVVQVAQEISDDPEREAELAAINARTMEILDNHRQPLGDVALDVFEQVKRYKASQKADKVEVSQ